MLTSFLWMEPMVCLLKLVGYVDARSGRGVDVDANGAVVDAVGS